MGLPDAENGHAEQTKSNGAPEQAAPLMPPITAELVKDAPALQTITSGELMPPPPPNADDADARPLEDHLRECVSILKRRKGREEPVALLLRDFCAAHSDQRHKVVKAGCIGPLIGLVRSSRTGSCKGAAAAALAQLAYDDEGNRQAILACEGEKPLGALVVDRNAPPTARAAACDCLANLAAGAADGVVAARLHVAAFTALATDDESSLEVKASAARALANALRPLEDVEDEAVNPSLSACALELLASDDHREAGASLARALVLATELDEATVKKLSAALVEAISKGSDPAIGALANLLARGATASASVLATLVATRSQASVVCLGNFALRDAGAVVDCGAVAVLAESLENEELRRSACAALRNVAASNPGAVAAHSEALARALGEVPNEAAGALQNIAMVQPAAVATYAPELAVALRDAPRKAASALAHIAARDPADVPVTPLVEALNNAKSAGPACCALACVASDTPGRAALVEAKGVPSLVALLEDDDAKCACAAAHVVRNLASDDKGRRALLINGGAAALSAAGLEGDDEATQLRVEAIANLCLGDAADRTAVVNAKCIRPLAKRAHVLKCGAASDALDRLSVDEAALVNKARASFAPKKATPRRLGPRRLGPTRKPAPYQCVSPVPPASADGPDAA
jgi:hypothetical protein